MDRETIKHMNSQREKQALSAAGFVRPHSTMSLTDPSLMPPGHGRGPTPLMGGSIPSLLSLGKPFGLLAKEDTKFPVSSQLLILKIKFR